MNGTNGISDMEGKAAGVAVNESGDEEFQTQIKFWFLISENLGQSVV
jgi:hypothetical protein